MINFGKNNNLTAIYNCNNYNRNILTIIFQNNNLFKENKIIVIKKKNNK
jgi:hypothetical protein